MIQGSYVSPPSVASQGRVREGELGAFTGCLGHPSVMHSCRRGLCEKWRGGAGSLGRPLKAHQHGKTWKLHKTGSRVPGRPVHRLRAGGGLRRRVSVYLDVCAQNPQDTNRSPLQAGASQVALFLETFIFVFSN